jgi:hypothetical protein
MDIDHLTLQTLRQEKASVDGPKECFLRYHKGFYEAPICGKSNASTNINKRTQYPEAKFVCTGHSCQGTIGVLLPYRSLAFVCYLLPFMSPGSFPILDFHAGRAFTLGLSIGSLTMAIQQQTPNLFAFNHDR